MKINFHRSKKLSLSLKICLVLVAIALTVVLSAPLAIVERAAVPKTCNPHAGKVLAKTELIFGLSRPDRPTIGEAEFQKFIDRQVTPRFPDGLTILNATGQFKDRERTIVKEGTKLLLLLHNDDALADEKIERIRQTYKQMFDQESVLRVDDRLCVSF